jgi:hypothetical protein
VLVLCLASCFVDAFDSVVSKKSLTEVNIRQTLCDNGIMTDTFYVNQGNGLKPCALTAAGAIKYFQCSICDTKWKLSDMGSNPKRHVIENHPDVAVMIGLKTVDLDLKQRRIQMCNGKLKV